MRIVFFCIKTVFSYLLFSDVYYKVRFNFRVNISSCKDKCNVAVSMFSETVEIGKLFGFIPTHRREAFCGVKSMIFILYSAVYYWNKYITNNKFICLIQSNYGMLKSSKLK